MQIGGTRYLTPMRQPTSMGTKRMQIGDRSFAAMMGQRLVFLYPMIADNQYFKYLNLFRDFFTVSFIGEIKISNALNITSDSQMNVGSIGSGNRAINPAQYVRQSLWAGDDVPSANVDNFDQWSSHENRQAYQMRIDQFNSFLQNQIKHDPRYSKFRPHMSSIVVDNLMMIPLIIGTQSYTVSSHYMYMLLVMAIAYDLPLTNSNNINRLFHIMDTTDPVRLLGLIQDEKYRTKLDNLIGYKPKRVIGDTEHPEDVPRQSIKRWLNSEKQMAKAFFDVVLNLRNWQTVTGNAESRETITINTITVPTATQARHYERAMSSFSSFIEHSIIPIFHGIEMLAGPTPGDISMSYKISTLVDNIVGEGSNISATMKEMSTTINSALNKIHQESNNDISKLQGSVNRIVSLCKENANIGVTVKSAFGKLEKNAQLPYSFKGSDLDRFVRGVTEVANRLNSRRGVIQNWIEELAKTDGGSNLRSVVHRVYSHIETQVKEMLYSEYPKGGSNNAPWIERFHDKLSFADRYKNYCHSILKVNYAPKLGEPSMNRTIEDNVTDKNINGFYQSIVELEVGIVNILKFLFEWNFFSYTCSYMNDIEADIEIQRRDALEFPNYCLVLPFELFKGLYMMQTVRDFKDYLNSKNTNNPLHFNQRDMMPNLGDVTRMINLVNDRLQVPNIILIDEKTRSCYYKFMYMSKPTRMPMSGLQQFVKHQQDVLPGY